jgi:hypothetical protein
VDDLRLIDERFRRLATEWSAVSFSIEQATRAYQPRATSDVSLIAPWERTRPLLAGIGDASARLQSIDLTYLDLLRYARRNARHWRHALAPACTVALTIAAVFSIANAPIYEASWEEDFNVSGSVSTGTWKDESVVTKSTCYPTQTNETTDSQSIVIDRPDVPDGGDVPSAPVGGPPDASHPEAVAPVVAAPVESPTETEGLSETATPEPTETAEPTPTETDVPATETDTAPAEESSAETPPEDDAPIETPTPDSPPVEDDVVEAATDVPMEEEPTETEEPTPTATETVVEEQTAEPVMTEKRIAVIQAPTTTPHIGDSAEAAPTAVVASTSSVTEKPAAPLQTVVEAALPSTIPAQPVFCSTKEDPS